MIDFKKVFLKLDNGEEQDFHARVDVKEEAGVKAVFFEGASNVPLDREFGAGIQISVDGAVRWMADYRRSEYWCSPAFGTDFSDIPDDTQGLIYEKDTGMFGVILPVVSENYKCVLAGDQEGCILAKLFSWNDGMTTCNALAFLWAEGENPYDLLESCARVGLKLSGTNYCSRKERRYPELFEYLGWCSWDAFEIRVDEQGLIQKCRELRDKNIPVKWAIIDDMWAEVRDFYHVDYKDRKEMFHLMHASKLYDFRADPIRFPNGLKHCIEEMNKYGFTVGMWYPTTGYWMGVDPDGAFYHRHKELFMQAEDGRVVPSCDRDKAYLYYTVIHDYLQKCGAEFVKIDNQSMTRRFYKNQGPVGQVARQFHDAMEASVVEHFDNQMINCMGMASEDMWNRSVSPVSRCSSDFQPEAREWFTRHITQCAYNCLIQGQFYYCDWDMWWTDDGQAEKNSILRAVSGGPIYVSDMLGRSRREVLMPLVLEDGRILRCDRPGMPAKDCLTKDPVSSGKLFKIQNLCNGSGVIAAFNLDEEDRAVTGTISPDDVEGLSGEEFAVYEHFSREMRIVKRGERFELELKDNDAYKVYVVVPLQDGNGMIGRIDKFISPKTVIYHQDGSTELIEEGPYAYVEDRQLKISR